MTDTVKTIELIGNSTESWEDAARNALRDADETIEGITGLEVKSQTATVENGRITRYKSTIHVGFTLEDR